MHIPDGYISPESAIIMYGAAAPFWYTASRRLKRLMSGQTVPLLAIFSAFSFTIMMFNIPVPGGTTAHAVGGTLAAIILGPWAAVITVSVALVIQALFFGDGGITAIGANCFNMAVALPFVGYAVYRLLSANAPVASRRRLVAAGIGSYLGINVAGLLVGFLLGIQPHFWTENGKALYAPYGLKASISAMLAAHLTVAGAAEVIATVFALAYVQRVHPYLLERRAPAAEPTLAPTRRSRRGWAPGLLALVVVLAVPLGLLASGSAWGEWGSEELAQRKDVGYVPQGMQRYEHVWKAPFTDYTAPWVPDNLSFTEQALAYILSAVAGIGLIFVAVFGYRVLNKRLAQRRRPREWVPA